MGSKIKRKPVQDMNWLTIKSRGRETRESWGNGDKDETWGSTWHANTNKVMSFSQWTSESVMILPQNSERHDKERQNHDSCPICGILMYFFLGLTKPFFHSLSWPSSLSSFGDSLKLKGAFVYGILWLSLHGLSWPFLHGLSWPLCLRPMVAFSLWPIVAFSPWSIVAFLLWPILAFISMAYRGHPLNRLSWPFFLR